MFNSVFKKIAARRAARAAEANNSPKMSGSLTPQFERGENKGHSFDSEGLRFLSLQDDPAQAPPWASRIGGLPALSPQEEWPGDIESGLPAVFVAQINLADLPEFAQRARLPARGLLSFFMWDPEPYGVEQDADGQPLNMPAEILWQDVDVSTCELRTPPGLTAQTEGRTRELYTRIRLNDEGAIAPALIDFVVTPSTTKTVHAAHQHYGSQAIQDGWFEAGQRLEPTQSMIFAKRDVPLDGFPAFNHEAMMVLSRMVKTSWYRPEEAVLDPTVAAFFTSPWYAELTDAQRSLFFEHCGGSLDKFREWDLMEHRSLAMIDLVSRRRDLVGHLPEAVQNWVERMLSAGPQGCDSGLLTLPHLVQNYQDTRRDDVMLAVFSGADGCDVTRLGGHSLYFLLPESSLQDQTFLSCSVLLHND